MAGHGEVDRRSAPQERRTGERQERGETRQEAEEDAEGEPADQPVAEAGEQALRGGGDHHALHDRREGRVETPEHGLLVRRLHGQELPEAGGHDLTIAEEEEQRDQHQAEVHHRDEQVPREARRLTDDLLGEPVHGAQEEIGELHRELLERGRDVQPDAAEPGGANLLDETQHLPLAHRLLDAGVGGRRLAHEERADEDGRQDDRDGDRQDEGQRRERAPALEGAAEPRRQRVEGERQDRRPHERDEEGREEEVELVEEEEEDGEEESREELLPRHRAATVAVAALDHKAHRRRRRVALTPRGGVGTKTPLRRCAQARSSVGERFLDTEEAGGSIPPVPIRPLTPARS